MTDADLPDYFQDFPEHLWAAWITPTGSTYKHPVKVTAAETNYWAEDADELWAGASWFANDGNHMVTKLGWDQYGSHAVYASTDKTEVQTVINTVNQMALTVAGSLGLAPVKSVKYRRQ